MNLIISSLDGTPQMQTESVTFLGIEADLLDGIVRKAGASAVQILGNYREQRYERDSSVDLIVVAEK